MEKFSKKMALRWADLDPNFHLRHSIYYDLAAQCRMEILEQMGLNFKLMQKEGFSPVLFREECIFKREIRLSDTVIINIKIAKMKPDGSKWTVKNEFISGENKLNAILTVEGNWFDTRTRKLASPPPKIVVDIFNLLPKTDDFILG